MAPKEALGLVLRVAGLGFIFCAVADLGHIVLAAFGSRLMAGYRPIDILGAAGFWALLGLGTIASANVVARLLYGRD